MRLKELLPAEAFGFRNSAIAGMNIPAVWDDSRRVTPGSLFVVLPGGEKFMRSGLDRGAAVMVLPKGQENNFVSEYPQVVFVPVDDSRQVFKEILTRFYGEVSQQVRVIGVTGTNGKTTVTYFLEAVLKAAGKLSGVVGTVNCRVGDKTFLSKNTTPGMLDNQIFLSDLAHQNIPYAVMEVSSHALAQGRVDLIDFQGAVFSNLTGDHLDFHGTMESYFEAKSRLFRALSPQSYAVFNNDDEYGRRLSRLTRARRISYGLHSLADVTAEIKAFGLRGTRLAIRAFGKEIELSTMFIGHHNIYNILAAFSAGLGEGFDFATIKRGIESLEHVPGRLERVDCGQDFCVFIDYAHTDDGLKNVLECLKKVQHNRLIVVYGCGGDRDRSKRPRMGRVACELADHSIVTSDNPRSEDPQMIIADVLPGYTRNNYDVQPDREKAIEHAIAIARKDDIVLLAGKGHETYQVLKDRTIDFVERDILTRILRARQNSGRSEML